MDVPHDPHARLDANYAAEVAPAEGEIERARRKWLGWSALAAALAVVLLVAVLATEPYGLAGALPLVALAAIACVVMARHYRNQVRRELMPAVCRAVGEVEHRVGGGDFPLARLERAQVISAAGRESTIDDVFEGDWRGVGFRMADANLKVTVRTGRTTSTGMFTASKGTTSRQVFRGLLFAIATPYFVEPAILLRGRRRQWLPWRRRRSPRGLKPVGLPHPAFNEQFELWSSNPVRAVDVITPGFADTMAHLAATAGPGKLDAAFSQDLFLLALPRRGDRFAAGSLLRSAHDLGRDAHTLLDEVLTVHRLIDLLLDGTRPSATSSPDGATA